MVFDPQPVLHGRGVWVRPLLESDRDALYAVARDPLIWEQHPVWNRYLPEVFGGFFTDALRSGGALAVIAGDGEMIGSSRFGGYDPQSSEVEIGWTFLARGLWGGATNRELKRIMLEHAFESVDRVVFLVGPDNHRSQRALERLGARRAGTRLDSSGQPRVLFELTRDQHRSQRSGDSPRSQTPRVALLPGAGGAGAFWQPVADRLPAGWTRTLVSWPGAGDQPHNPDVHSYEDLVERTAAALVDCSDLVAQSMGGVVAIGVALAHPDKIRRLVLIASSGGIAVDALGAQDWRRKYKAEFPAAAPWVTSQQVDYAHAVASITAPTCLIWGEADPISPVSVGERLHQLLPDSSLHVLTGGTHSLAHDRPDEVAALIAQHLR